MKLAVVSTNRETAAFPEEQAAAAKRNTYVKDPCVAAAAAIRKRVTPK